MRPTTSDIKIASKDVAWEYVTLLGAALEMAEGPRAPINHFVQDAFLVHTRNLAEFFREGAETFEENQPPPKRKQNKIYAIDFCSCVKWNPEPFAEKSELIRAINQTLSHMTYQRTPGSKGYAYFDGGSHVHGTVELMRRTWRNFMLCVKPDYREDIHFWLTDHTEEWRVNFDHIENRFEVAVRQWQHWTLNLTPNGPVVGA